MRKRALSIRKRALSSAPTVVLKGIHPRGVHFCFKRTLPQRALQFRKRTPKTSISGVLFSKESFLSRSLGVFEQQKSRTNPQKSPMNPQKSPRYPQKGPIIRTYGGSEGRPPFFRAVCRWHYPKPQKPGYIHKQALDICQRAL